MASNEIAGAKEKGVYSFMKHFALNDQETKRTEMLCTWTNEQAMRIVVPVKMPGTRNGTKRPREPLLQLSAEFGYTMCRIGRRH